MEESVPPETLALIVSEFYEEFENRFGSHIHILDWALHLDEGTPHIHERHVFDCENRYGAVSYTHLDVYKRQTYVMQEISLTLELREILMFLKCRNVLLSVKSVLTTQIIYQSN